MQPFFVKARQRGVAKVAIERRGQRGHLTTGNARQPARLLRRARAQQKCLTRQIQRRSQGQGAELAADLFGHNAQLQRAQANATASLGQHQRGHAQPGQPLPGSIGMRATVVDDGARFGYGRLLDEELAYLVTQHVLVVGKIKVHGVVPRC